jgi:hypothetical protein
VRWIYYYDRQIVCLRVLSNSKIFRFQIFKEQMKEPLAEAKVQSSNSCGRLPEMRISIKEVIQPQVPLGLPCYDFTPVMNHSVVTVLPKVRLATSGATHSHGVTGGVYKARERIHRDILIHDY